MMQRNHGLTLIEVLIALAIAGIAIIAIIKAVTQNIHSTAYLQRKTMAMWVAQDVINETRAHLLQFETSSGNQKLTTELFGQDWFWKRDMQETPNPKIKQVIVRVFDKSDDDETSPIITMESYVYHEK